jgi:hypothetical protein
LLYNSNSTHTLFFQLSITLALQVNLSHGIKGDFTRLLIWLCIKVKILKSFSSLLFSQFKIFEAQRDNI